MTLSPQALANQRDSTFVPAVALSLLAKRPTPALLTDQGYAILHEAIISGERTGSTTRRSLIAATIEKDLVAAAREHDAAVALSVSDASLDNATDRIRALLAAKKNEEGVTAEGPR
jgi:hypothetical protein